MSTEAAASVLKSFAGIRRTPDAASQSREGFGESAKRNAGNPA